MWWSSEGFHCGDDADEAAAGSISFFAIYKKVGRRLLLPVLATLAAREACIACLWLPC